MRQPILAKLPKLPSDAELRVRRAEIEHVLYGNKSDVERLASEFAAKGWKAKAEPMNEIGWAAIVNEDAVRFRSVASQRIAQLCAIAEQNDVKYETWRLNAPGIATYISQPISPSQVAEEHPTAK